MDMKRDLRWFSVASLIVLSCTLLSCTGGGGGGGGGGSPPPLILAELDSFPPGAAPLGFNSSAAVAVLDDSSGDSITTATVTMNGMPLTYDATNEEYEGNVLVAPGGAVTLGVAVGGATYTASTTQFASYPTISAPASGASWDTSVANTVMWSGGAPTTNAIYGVGILDAADPNGPTIWPFSAFVQDVPIGTTSFSIPAFNVTAGDRFLIVGIGSPGVPVLNAAPGSILAVGGFNFISITVPGMPVTSRDSGTMNTLNGVTWSGTQFVAVGDGGTILTSPDGITWTSRAPSSPAPLLYGAAWSGTKFVAVGRSSGLLTGAEMTSADGITWTAQDMSTLPFAQPWDLKGVVWTGTQFVAVGGGDGLFPGEVLATSPDGVTWTARNYLAVSHAALAGIAWSGTLLLAVGGNGEILTSPDGVTWTGQASGSSSNLLGVTWSGTQFVVLGESGTILTSPDGTTWTSRVSGTTNNLRGVAWSGTEFLAAGLGGGNVGTILNSPDGITWTQQASGTASDLLGVAWSGTTFVTVGGNGTILTSP